MKVDSPHDATFIDDNIRVARDIEDSYRVAEAVLGNRVWPVEFMPLENLPGFRKVFCRRFEVGRIDVDQNDRQLFRSNLLLYPLDQRESFDTGVSGDAPDVDDERLAGHCLQTDLPAVGRFEREGRACASDDHAA